MVTKIHWLKKFLPIIEIIRVDQWVKNFVIVSPLFIKKNILLFDIYTLFLIFFIFCFLSSIVYVFNDIIDLEKDKLNPFKANRPLVKKTITIHECYKIIPVLFISLLILLLYFKTYSLIYILAIYIIINFFYTLKLKEIFLLDILIISLGYILRVMAGYTQLKIQMDLPLLLGVFLISLLILIIKRKNEYNNFIYKKSLANYKKNYLLSILFVFISFLFIFNYYFFFDLFTNQKKFFITYFLILIVILRLNFLFFIKKIKENITNFIIKDIYLLLCLTLWIVFFFL
jgi:4-hydroxybenzoate polyprenyltransferase